MSSVREFLAVPSHRAPVASPAGDRVAYVHADEEATLRVRSLADAGPRALDVPIPDEPAHALISWTPDGDGLVVRCGRAGLDAATIDLVGLDGDDDRRTLVDRPGQSIPYDVGPGHVYYLQNESDRGSTTEWALRRAARAGGADERLLGIPRVAGLVGAGLSPSGDRLAASSARPESPRDSVVRILAPDGTPRRTVDLRDAEGRAYAQAWGPEGRRLLVNGQIGVGRVGVVDLAADDLTWHTPDGVAERGVAILPDGRLLTERRTDRRRRLVLHEDGEERPLAHPGTARIPPSRAGGALTDDGVVLLRTTETRPWETLHVPLDGEPTVLDPVELGAAPQRAATAPERVDYPVGDDETLTGLLYHPGDGPAPAVALVYGARTNPSPWFRPEAGLLLDRGYAVFVPTTREDTYHGLDDFVAGLAWLADSDRIDGDRVAAYGHSHGGYDALVLATRYPERIAAAVAHGAPTDLPALAEGDEAVPNVAAQLGPYDDNDDRWRERSPVASVADLRVPTLHVHGTEDWVVPPSQGRRFRDAVRDAEPDVAYEYVELDGGHGSTDPTRRADVWARVLDFLDDHLPD